MIRALLSKEADLKLEGFQGWGHHLVSVPRFSIGSMVQTFHLLATQTGQNFSGLVNMKQA